MSEHQRQREGMFSARAGALGGRRRTAPRAEETSDVRRFRGVLGASVAAALAVVGAMVLTIDPTTERAPGPVSVAHQAATTCASCHADDGQPVASRCVSCHGPHPSTRPGHRRLAGTGALPCTSCHAAHGDYGGVAFLPEGAVLRFGAGAKQEVPELHGPALAELERVPVIPAGRCARCHDPDASEDPIVRCLFAEQRSLGDARPTVCFDEHQEFRWDSFSRGEGVYARSQLWTAARRAVTAIPVAPQAPPREGSAWWWIGVAALAGTSAWGLARLLGWVLARRRRGPVVAAAVEPPKVKRLPQINTATCIGCHACVDACPYDVLEVRSFVAVVVRPDDCCGLTLCEQRCPNGSLVVTDGEPIEDRPRVDGSLQSLDTPGLYVAGDLTGLPLIRNAINQGARAARAAIESLRAEPGRAGAGSTGEDPSVELLDLVVVGSGPAGLSASLAAAEAGLRTVTLEQGSVAESIRSFPRGKLVFDQPLGLPLEGDLWLAESTKEELLGQWRRIIRSRRLPIEEGVRVTAVRSVPGGSGPRFEVEGQGEAGPRRWRARRVILALGRRGTPRKLDVPIPEALAARVHYSMADARSFAGQRVLVVGLGDVAMEAAIALSRQPSTTVTVSYRGREFRRGKGRNIEQVERLAAAGRIDLRLGTEVVRVDEGAIVLRGRDGESSVPWDVMMVMIGSLAPWGFLETAGVRRARVRAPVAPDDRPPAAPDDRPPAAP
ncbi:NAD(P)-binding domain-containing protein [Paraliomyxa miuraensis]|uniref:NAD(P)-binding domain-containing protein n=1 Tax=Paraliomyxa miuraensis TaxID=376150 RepID=UPI00225AC213|nr:NAD(P)-binding domain-containing protein [Paraliomyxa miuraensis]MCX4245600.1 NAD(P)-binding domain-containing protein [Paraliomyxa miuraensis]